MSNQLALETQPWRRMGRALGLGTVLIFLAISLFLILRRLTGELAQPLPPLAICLTGSILALSMTAVRLAADTSRIASLVFFLPTVAGLLSAAAISLPGSAAWSLVILWTLVTLPELGWLLFGRHRVGHRVGTVSEELSSPQDVHLARPLQQGSGQDVHLARPLQQGSGQDVRNAGTAGTTTDGGNEQAPLGLEAPARSATDVEIPAREREDEEPLLPEGVLQQISQAVDENGDVWFYGLLRAVFDAGERIQALHVAFCPPLDSAPQVTAYQLEGPPALVKVAEVQVYGVRLEVRREAPADEPAEVLLQFETG